MRALLDTNIIIHRENIKATNLSIGQLFYWLDALHYEKLIHPYSQEELKSYQNPEMQALYDVKLSAYTLMKSIAPQTTEFNCLLSERPETQNDAIDNQLLFEVFCGRADILITEDRRLRNKAERLGIANKVFSINAFITKSTQENPALITYSALSVKQECFGNIDVTNSFFDTFRDSYVGFEKWFASKCDENAYVCRTDNSDILGFLYLKTEYENENYSDIYPAFLPAKRLKIGTFKVEASGFRLGERFIKIIFDNAIQRNVNEIYVTLYMDRPELRALYDLLIKWGFYEHGVKRSNEKEELVLVKKIGVYEQNKDIIWNFPNINNQKKMILPIMPQYHTNLFPDSKLNTENEVDFMENVAHRYALQKVYITWSYENNVAPGDILLFYRMGDKWPKKYSSVLTSIGVVDKIIDSFVDENDFLKQCQNRSVFTIEELKSFWRSHRTNLKILKFVYAKSLNNRLNLEYLWDNGIVPAPNGPRPFTTITEEQFKMILKDSNTELNI